LKKKKMKKFFIMMTQYRRNNKMIMKVNFRELEAIQAHLPLFKFDSVGKFLCPS